MSKGRKSNIRFFGRDSIHARHVAATVAEPMSRTDLERGVYGKLVPDARLQIRLARKWGVWGVMATDAWAAEFGPAPTPPNNPAEPIA